MNSAFIVNNLKHQSDAKANAQQLSNEQLFRRVITRETSTFYYFITAFNN